MFAQINVNHMRVTLSTCLAAATLFALWKDGRKVPVLPCRLCKYFFLQARCPALGYTYSFHHTTTLYYYTDWLVLYVVLYKYCSTWAGRIQHAPPHPKRLKSLLKRRWSTNMTASYSTRTVLQYSECDLAVGLLILSDVLVSDSPCTLLRSSYPSENDGKIFCSHEKDNMGSSIRTFGSSALELGTLPQ